MLSNEQIIAVAGEVWGWKQLTDMKPSEAGLTVWEKPHTQWASYEVDIKKEVLSWQGFGRTVEAMAKRKLFIEIQAPIIDHYNVEFLKGRGIFYTGQATERSLIEATHLAALEAVRQDKK